MTRKKSIMQDKTSEDFSIVNVLIPVKCTEAGKERDRAYRRVDVHVANGLIASIEEHSPSSKAASHSKVIDGENRLLLPGYA